MWWFFVAEALAQDPALSEASTAWFNEAAAAGAGLAALGTGLLAIYQYFLKPTILKDVDEVVNKRFDDFGAQLAEVGDKVTQLTEKAAAQERRDLETWGTDDRGLLHDVRRLVDEDILRRVQDLERHIRAMADAPEPSEILNSVVEEVTSLREDLLKRFRE
jgi:hypothetical protein